MEALKGTPGERAAACVAAGCDVALPCNGVLADNSSCLACRRDQSRRRRATARALAGTRIEVEGMDFADAIATRDQLLALA